MIQENAVLAKLIIERFPNFERFISGKEEEYSKTLEGIMEGLNFVSRNPSELNILLETIDEKLRKDSKASPSASGIMTLSSILHYNVSNTGITISSSLKDEDHRDPYKMIIKSEHSADGELLTVSYGEVPVNSDSYANGICTKTKGGTTFFEIDRNGNILDFDQLLNSDKRISLEVPEIEPRKITPEERESMIEEMWETWREVHGTDFSKM